MTTHSPSTAALLEPARTPWTATRWVMHGLSPARHVRLGILALCLGLIPMIGYADFLTGYEATFATFYLVPVLLVSWSFGRRAGIATALACAASGLLADWAIPHAGSWPVYFWNAGSRAVLLVLSAVLTAATNAALRERTELARSLERALEEVKTLEGLLPICAWCKRIRDERGEEQCWHEVERYIGEHSDVTFTHGICPDCTTRLAAEGRGQFSDAE